MGLYNRAIRTQRTPARPGTHEGVLKKLLRSNPDTHRYASIGPTDHGRRAPTYEPTATLTERDLEKKKN